MDALTRLRELDAKASKGPWICKGDDKWGYLIDKLHSEAEPGLDGDDARLICAARNLLPAFIEFVEFFKEPNRLIGIDTLSDAYKKLDLTIEKELGK